jgi:hypothetical protein
MFEESVETFIVRWRPFTTAVRLFSRTEGSPLLECEVAGTILQVLERTGPYLSIPGDARMILNITTDRLEVVSARQKRIESTGIGAVRVAGVVLLREEDMIVVDGGAPLVVGVHEPLADSVAAGDFVVFDAIPPIHGFVVSSDARGSQSGASQDELM